jgi:hypothetical protein
LRIGNAGQLGVIGLDSFRLDFADERRGVIHVEIGLDGVLQFAARAASETHAPAPLRVTCGHELGRKIDRDRSFRGQAQVALGFRRFRGCVEL